MRILAFILVGLTFFLPLAARVAEVPGEILEQILAAELDPARAVAVERLEIDMGMGHLDLESGTLIPAATVGGRTCELVFVGRGRFRIEPPDPVEAQQLELFTGQASLDVEIDSAVIVVGNPTIVSSLLERSIVSVGASLETEARELFDEWVAGTERKGFGAPGAMLSSVFGDSAYQNYFTVLLHSEELGRFFYILDPTDTEQVSLGQFVPVELDDREKYRVERAIARAQRRGRSIQTRLSDLGDWNSWLRSSLIGDQGEPNPGRVGFEPRHYTLEASLTPGTDQRLEGLAIIDLIAEVDGRRGLTLHLFSDLKPRRIRDGEGRDLPWHRVGSDLFVLLDQPVDAGDVARLEIEYGGVVFDKLEKGVFRLRSTRFWHPRAGGVDRATYDVTLRWPKRHELLASGRVVEQGDEGGQRMERRSLDVPSLGFSFEVGAFSVVQDRVGHVELTVGFSKTTISMAGGVKEEVLEVLKNALLFYEQQYGKFPLDQLSVATIPRRFSQGFLGFVTLSHYVTRTRVGDDSRPETIAHELAHQWWGNTVGWHSYRDQWISEALADYSATLFMAHRAERKAVYLAEHARDWKRGLRRSTRDGIAVESLGPVVLGERLISSMSTTAYTSIVYNKGSVVFSMLARILGEEPLNAMLHELADAVANRTIDTETFIKSLEKMSGVDLGWFARQYVYGTGIPEVYYRYSFQPGDDGQWRIEGEARQIGQARFRYTLVRTASGNWDSIRERVGAADVSNRILVVPFQVNLAGGESDDASGKKKSRSRSGVKTGLGLGGDMVMRGGLTRFSFLIERKPLDFWLDQRGEVLAWFYSENQAPKKTLRYQAMELSPAEAEPMLRRALSAPLLSESVRARSELSAKELANRTRVQDARIHLLLARLYLDQNRPDEAREELQVAEEMFNKWEQRVARSERHILRCRLDLRDGEYRAVYKAMQGTVRLPFPRLDSDTAANDVRRNRWSEGRRGDGEDFAVLAAAAHQTGHPKVALRALQEAEGLGADVDALRGVLAH